MAGSAASECIQMHPPTQCAARDVRRTTSFGKSHRTRPGVALCFVESCPVVMPNELCSEGSRDTRHALLRPEIPLGEAHSG
jgi:hypothetical protein